MSRCRANRSPRWRSPFVVVYTVYPGVSPTDMETLVTRPIETELKAVSGIKEIRSTTSEGLSSIEVEFNPEQDLETALANVREKVDLAKPDLPPEAEDPRVQDVDFSQLPILLATLSGPVRRPAAHRGRRGDAGGHRGPSRRQPGDRGSAAGSGKSMCAGGPQAALSLLRAQPRRPGDRGGAGEPQCPRRARSPSAGWSTSSGSPPRCGKPSEIEDFVIKVREGQPVFVREMWRPSVFGFEDESSRSRVDREPSVTPQRRKRHRREPRRGRGPRETPRLIAGGKCSPAGISASVVGDISVEIRRMVSELENNVISGLLLVVGCLMAFVAAAELVLRRGGDPALDDGLVPRARLDRLHAEHDGAVQPHPHAGMLVDNAVVIVENIYRHPRARRRRPGPPPTRRPPSVGAPGHRLDDHHPLRLLAAADLAGDHRGLHVLPPGDT